MPNRTRATLTIAVALLATIFAGSSPATATVRDPSFYITPNPVAPGQTITGEVVWFMDPGNYLVGCKDDVDYYVTDPGGRLIASGTLPAGVANSPLQTVSTFQLQIPADAPLGTYSVTSEPTICETTYAQGEFEVAEPTTPHPQIKLEPYSQTRQVGENAVVTATLTDAAGQPLPQTPLLFGVTGPNAGVTGACSPADCRTDSAGAVTFDYRGTAEGDDSVYASAEVAPAGDAVGVSWLPSLRGAAFAALGDSYSAGEGTYDYLPGTDVAGGNRCHRSSKAYSQLLLAGRNLGSTAFRACSGAITDDLFDSRRWEPAQLCQVDDVEVVVAGGAVEKVTACPDGVVPAIGPDTKRITLTIGGNDAGFAAILGKCVWASAAHANFGRPGRLCSASNSVVDPTMRRILALGGRRAGVVQTPGFYPIHSFQSVLETIHKLAPNAHVYIAGYPRLFQPGSGADCLVGAVVAEIGGVSQTVKAKIAPVDALWIDSMAELLNISLRSTARTAGPWVTYVDMSTPFTGHGICSKDPWINSISGNAVVADFSLDIDVESVHPSQRGQQAYAAAFRKAGALN